MGTSFAFVPTVSAILIGLIIGYIVALFLGIVDTSAISEAAWFGIPLPMQFKLEFQLPAIISFAALFVTSGLETIGNTSGITIAGFFQKLGAIFSAIPNAVLGGAIITVFGMILINGIKMISKAGFSERNILVMGLTFAFGLRMASHPDAVAQLPSVLKFVFSDAVTGTCIVAIIANLLFPMKDATDIAKAKEAMMG